MDYKYQHRDKIREKHWGTEIYSRAPYKRVKIDADEIHECQGCRELGLSNCQGTAYRQLQTSAGYVWICDHGAAELAKNNMEYWMSIYWGAFGKQNH